MSKPVEMKQVVIDGQTVMIKVYAPKGRKPARETNLNEDSLRARRLESVRGEVL